MERKFEETVEGDPPALMAAIPVGARMMFFFFVVLAIWRRNVDLPSPPSLLGKASDGYK